MFRSWSWPRFWKTFEVNRPTKEVKKPSVVPVQAGFFLAGRVSGFQGFKLGFLTEVVPVFNPQYHYEEKQLPKVEERDGKKYEEEGGCVINLVKQHQVMIFKWSWLQKCRGRSLSFVS